MAAVTFPVASGGSANGLVLRAATAACLGRYRGQTRLHGELDLRVFLGWYTEQELDPLAAVLTHAEHEEHRSLVGDVVAVAMAGADEL